VAEALGLSPSAAAKRIARSRAAGYLGPAEQGKATVGLMGRGGTASLESQIAIDKERVRRRFEDAGQVGES
jgi:hypothetical protein